MQDELDALDAIDSLDYLDVPEALEELDSLNTLDALDAVGVLSWCLVGVNWVSGWSWRVMFSACMFKFELMLERGASEVNSGHTTSDIEFVGHEFPEIFPQFV